jgi:UDP-glucuronate 4-epimerase
MRILVTGGAGFIGSHLCDLLLREGQEVTCLDNFDPYYDPRLKRSNLRGALRNDRFRLVEGDIRDVGLLDGLLKQGFDRVVHLAALAGTRNSLQAPQRYADVDYIGTINVLAACARHEAGGFIFASTSSVYGLNSTLPFREDDRLEEQASPYAVAKRAAELYVATDHRIHHVPTTILRFFTVYGPRQRPDMAISRFMRLMREGAAVPMYGDGSSRRDYTYVEDVVAAIWAAITRNDGFEIYNLGSGSTISLDALIQLLGRSLNLSPIIEVMPPQLGDVPVTHADISKARAALNYAPRPIDSGLSQLIDAEGGAWAA